MESNIIFPLPSASEPKLQTNTRASPRSMEPKKQQWALIYNQEAEQFKQLKNLQKQLNKEKMQQFKKELEKQLNSKSSMHESEKLEDMKYSQYMKNKIIQEEAREQNIRLQKLLQRRRIQQENYNKHEASKSSRIAINNRGGVGLDIGYKSEMQKAQERTQLKKDLTDTLDKQLKMKEQEKLNQRQNESRLEEANKKYMSEYYNRRDSTGPRRRQNEDIYHYFEKINEQKSLKEKELERKLVDQAIVQRQIQEARREDDKKRQREQTEKQVRKIIEGQLKYKSEQNINQKKYNPEQNSYQIIGGIFRDKQSSHDKKKYFEFLARQAEQQALRKKKWDFMSDEEYRLNMNQLNRVVTGTYEHDRYIDRSVNSIGVSKLRGSGSTSVDLGRKPSNDDDAVAVQEKLNEIRKNGVDRTSSVNKSFHL